MPSAGKIVSLMELVSLTSTYIAYSWWRRSSGLENCLRTVHCEQKRLDCITFKGDETRPSRACWSSDKIIGEIESQSVGLHKMIS